VESVWSQCGVSVESVWSQCGVSVGPVAKEKQKVTLSARW